MQQLINRTNDEWGIIPLQNCILNIAKYIHDICKAQDITYYLMGGSALGAVRHKGFIPWDDDLDIFMRPNDYAKFRRYFKECGNHTDYYLQEWGESKGKITLAKLRYNQSSFIEEDLKDWDINHGVFVDIFILHNTPNNIFKRYNQYFWAKYLVVKGASNRNYARKGKIVNLILKTLKIMPKRALLDFALNQIYKADKKESSNYCHFIGRANMSKGVYNKDYFSGIKEVDFESIKLYVPQKVEKYLSDRWGDYMKLPSASEINHYKHSWDWSTICAFDKKGAGNYRDESSLIT